MTTKALIFIAVFSSVVFATQIFYEPLDSVVKKTQYALLVEIQSIGSVQEDKFDKKIGFKAVPLKIIIGKLRRNKELTFMYSEGKPHVRGKMMVSPRVSGSGLEFKLKRGAKVILLIARNSGLSTSLNVLRIEPEENMSAVMAAIETTRNAEQPFPADQQ